MKNELNPMIKCKSCKKQHGLFDYELDESAILTCPTCGTKMELSAAVKDAPEGENPELQDIAPDIPKPPETPPSTATAAGPEAAPQPPMESHTEKWIKTRLDEGFSVEKILDVMLGETADSDQIWKGGLAQFNTKLELLAKDVGFSGDLGDLVAELQDGDALEVKKDTVVLDIVRARQVLVKHIIEKGDHGVELEGDLDLDMDLGDDGGFEQNLMQAEPPTGETVTVGKALDRYFS